jgi:NAD(P)-dependent dehydrogenase (short-subunit alcohol dehydrogenase family)
MASPVVLVTGASSGIGQAAATLLARRGFRVFGTSRRPGTSSQLEFPLVALDVRSDTSVDAAVKNVLEQAGRIDVLVNNAGFAQSGALEEVQLQEATAQFDTNVYGVLRVTQAVLPTMRAQQSGRIITTSSLVGQLAPPFLGVYAASKFAIEGMMESLRAELRPFGIGVSLIEPGFVKSNIVSNTPARVISEYDRGRQAAREFARQGVAHGMDPRAVADVVLRVATTPNPGLRYRVGRTTSVLIGLKRWLPEPIFERVAVRAFSPR